MKKMCWGLLLVIQVAWAGEPVLNFRQYQVTFDYLSVSGDTLYDTFKHEEPIQLGDDSYDYDASLQTFNLRYGATTYATLVLRGYWFDHELKGSDQQWSNSAFQSYYVGVQLRRDAGRFHTFQWDIGYYADGSYDADVDLPVGSGESTWEISGNYLFSLNPYHAFFDFDLGYRFPGGRLSDELFVHAGYTYRLKGGAQFRLFYHTLESQDSSRIPFNPLNYPVERGFQKSGVEISVALGKRLALFAGYQSVMGGRNAFQTSGFRTGFSYLFK